MQVVPLSAVPSQTLSVGLGGQSVQINVYQLGAGYATRMYIDVISNGVVILTARLCRAFGGLPNTSPRFIMTGRHYLGFLGDLLFVDTQANTNNPTQDPQYTGLGARWQLLYFSVADLQGAGLLAA